MTGIKFTSKKVLQWAVVLLGFGLDLTVVLKTGKQSLPIIVCTIAVSLLIAFVLHKALRIPSKISTLVGVGSSICGGSAIAATAPVIDADDEEVAQSISVIFFFNVLAAILFPILGNLIGFSTTSGEAFGIFAGTAVNDTSRRIPGYYQILQDLGYTPADDETSHLDQLIAAITEADSDENEEDEENNQ